MSAVENRALVLDFFDGLSTRRFADSLELIDDDGSWWVTGKPHYLPLSGTYRKKELVQLFALVGSAMPDGITMTITGTIAEDDRVAVEAAVYGVSPTGKVYDNQICFVVTVRDGKIHLVREYFDTIHTNEVLFNNVYQPS